MAYSLFGHNSLFILVNIITKNVYLCFVLLKSLAFQVGSEVPLNELARQVELDKNNVEKYIQLLEQTQVIFRLSSLSRNLCN